jgi:hypothetical protein
MGKKRVILLLIGVVVVAAVGAGVWYFWPSKKKAATQPTTNAQEADAVAKARRESIESHFANEANKDGQSQTDRLNAQITHITFMSGTGKGSEALKSALEAESEFPLELVQKQGLFGIISGLYAQDKNTRKADEYWNKYIDGLKATGQAELAAQLEASKKEGNQQ